MNPDQLVSLPSNRSFGLMFVAVMSGLAMWGYYHQQPSAMWWAISAAILLFVTLVFPNLLTPANRLWMKLGLVLGKIVSPVVIGGMYFILIVPVGLAMRLGRRDPLHLAYDKTAETYWVERIPPGPTKESFKNQF